MEENNGKADSFDISTRQGMLGMFTICARWF